MSELRHDPIQKRWIIIATDRAQRPDSFAVEPERVVQGAFCPFCGGNEESTPPEIVAIRDREALLAEKMAEEKRDKKVADYARRIAVRQLEQTLRSDYEEKLEKINSEWEQREARERLSTEQDLSNVFRQITSQMQSAPL